MQRPNWMTFAMYAIPIVCAVIAFSIGFYTWTHLKQSEQDLNRVKVQLSSAKLQRDSSKQNLEKIKSLPQLTAPIDPIEKIEFFHTIPQLMTLSGVAMVRMEPKPLERIDPIATPVAVKPPATTNTGTGQPAPAPKPQLPYSITFLPLGVRAISTTVAVRGTYQNIHNFIWRLNNFRYSGRAINLNSITMNDWNEKTQTITAVLVVTRFVRPPVLTPGMQIPPAPGAPGNPGGESLANQHMFKGVKEADPGALLHPGGHR